DLKALGERTVTIDCDVIQADGGTRTAAITGGYVALALAVQRLVDAKKAKPNTMLDHVVAVSAGFVEGAPHLDLDYDLDSQADVDMNFVMTGSGHFIEMQGTGEKTTFSREQFNTLVDLALGGLPQLLELQRRALELPFRDPPETVRL